MIQAATVSSAADRGGLRWLYSWRAGVLACRSSWSGASRTACCRCRGSSGLDVVRQAARIAGRERHLFFAPLLMDDAAAAAAVRRDPTVDEATARRVADEGAVGEPCGVFFDERGHPIPPR